MPTWAVGLLSGVLLWSLVSDLISTLGASTAWSAPLAVVALTMIMGHVAIAIAGLWPHAAAVLIWCVLPITIASGYIGITGIAVAVSTVAVVALCRRRWMAAHLVIVFAAVLGQSLRNGDTLTLWVNLLFLLPAAAVGGVVRYFLLRAAGERERVRLATETAEQVREQERLALSRELHDAVSSGLALISMETASVEDSDDAEELRGALEMVQQVARETSAELRLLVRTLRDPAAVTMAVPTSKELDGQTLASVTARLTTTLEERGFKVTMDLEGLGDTPSSRLGPTVLHTYLRIAQESVTNVIKHSPQGAACLVKAAVEGDTLNFALVSDLPPNGVPAVRVGADSGGIGLQSIRERVTMTAGSVSYGQRGGQWVVEASLPMSGSSDEASSRRLLRR